MDHASSGAASLKNVNLKRIFRSGLQLCFAAPEDGRTPASLRSPPLRREADRTC